MNLRDRIARAIWDRHYTTNGFPSWGDLQDPYATKIPHVNNEEGYMISPNQLKSRLDDVKETADAIVALLFLSGEQDA